MKVLIAPDKFKGTLRAQDAAQAIARGWRSRRPEDELTLLPITDGGDGFGEIIGASMQAAVRRCAAHDAARRPGKFGWRWSSAARTALVESAEVIGLARLPANKPHPFERDSFGLGQMLQQIARHEPKRIIVGLGGSATNDGGFGMARALGWRFFASDGRTLERWTELCELRRIERPRRKLGCEILAAVDVRNKLLGPRGATHVFGPQKGLGRRDCNLAERCLARLALVAKRQFGRDFAELPGAGAAGGLGFGLAVFANAKLVSGFQVFARHAQLRRHIAHSHLVITGEGRLDASSFMGKGVGEVASICAEVNVPCIAIAGSASRHLGSSRFRLVASLARSFGRDTALRQSAEHLELLSSRLATCVSTLTRTG